MAWFLQQRQSPDVEAEQWIKQNNQAVCLSSGHKQQTGFTSVLRLKDHIHLLELHLRKEQEPVGKSVFYHSSQNIQNVSEKKSWNTCRNKCSHKNSWKRITLLSRASTEFCWKNSNMRNCWWVTSFSKWCCSQVGRTQVTWSPPGLTPNPAWSTLHVPCFRSTKNAFSEGSF